MSTETQLQTAAPSPAPTTAMAVASKGIRSGAADAKRSAQLVAEKTTQAISKTVYSTCYCISFGVMFPTFLLMSFVPKDNAICHGFVDGAHAAADSVHNLRNPTDNELEVSQLVDNTQPAALPAPA